MQSKKAAIEALLENPRVWRGHAEDDAPTGLASGFPELDRCLPGGGWPTDALTEILISQYGVGELRLLMPALAALTANAGEFETSTMNESGWIAWVAPPFLPYAPALEQNGVDLSRLLIVRPKDDAEILWSAEQALASGTCAAVLLWPHRLDDQASRRLQLAAEKGRSWAIAFRPLNARQQPSAAALRIELQSNEQGTRIHILKSRGGRPTVLNTRL